MDSNAHNDMADVYRLKGEFRKAIEFYDKTVSIDPLDTNAMLEKAQCLIQMKQMKEAEEQLDFLIEGFPSSRDTATAIVIKATLQIREKKYAPAYDLLLRALEYFPFNRAVLFQAALTAYFLKKYQQAENFLKKILEMTPDDKRARALLKKVQR